MNKPLYFWFWGWGGALTVPVSGRAGPCMLLHQLVLTTYTPRSQLVNKQNEYYRVCLQVSYLWAHIRLISDFKTAPELS